jgi:hypothetical protein
MCRRQNSGGSMVVSNRQSRRLNATREPRRRPARSCRSTRWHNCWDLSATRSCVPSLASMTARVPGPESLRCADCLTVPSSLGPESTFLRCRLRLLGSDLRRRGQRLLPDAPRPAHPMLDDLRPGQAPYAGCGTDAVTPAVGRPRPRRRRRRYSTGVGIALSSKLSFYGSQ